MTILPRGRTGVGAIALRTAWYPRQIHTARMAAARRQPPRAIGYSNRVWNRLFSWMKRPVPTEATVEKQTVPSDVAQAGAAEKLPFIHIEEVTDAAPFAGELFQRKFKHPVPDYPRHFVAFYQPAEGNRSTIGYVHYLPFEDVYLCGGMCVDTAMYRKLPKAHMDGIRRAGSLAEYLLRETFEMVGPCAAIFGSVGDATARVVDLRAGFIDTGEPHVMVVWRDARGAGEAEKRALVRKVVALGGF